MPIQHAVLALLGEGPSYGYELKPSFEEAIGPQWGELNIGHLYQILDRLIRDELVTSEVIPQTDRPNKTVYRLTDAGRAELERWLEAPFVRQGGYRDDFFLKLFAASRLGRRALGKVVRVQRQAYLEELAALAQLRSQHADDPLVKLLIEAAVLHTEANLRVVELADEARPVLAESKRRGRAAVAEEERGRASRAGSPTR
ncbi:MAG: PadR family transcriptional regulator [Actinobacteria bacterium]|nr:PadR family transcriptional regulator [Actinomycetota bacterium]